MKLVVGGYGQGKAAFACEKFGFRAEEVVDGREASLEELAVAQVVRNYHLYLRRLMEQGESLEKANEELLKRNPHVILIADEIGCGLVPLEAAEREYRDVVGHLLCKVAAEAEQVYRVFCGIGRRIK